MVASMVIFWPPLEPLKLPLLGNYPSKKKLNIKFWALAPGTSTDQHQASAPMRYWCATDEIPMLMRYRYRYRWDIYRYRYWWDTNRAKREAIFFTDTDTDEIPIPIPRRIIVIIVFFVFVSSKIQKFMKKWKSSKNNGCELLWFIFQNARGVCEKCVNFCENCFWWFFLQKFKNIFKNEKVSKTTDVNFCDLFSKMRKVCVRNVWTFVRIVFGVFFFKNSKIYEKKWKSFKNNECELERCERETFDVWGLWFFWFLSAEHFQI